MASPRVSFNPLASPSHADKDAATPAKPVNKWKEWFFGIPGILTGAILGIVIGYLVQRAEPSEEVVSWIAIPGDLFIRAIKSLVGPLVFCSLVVGMSDLVAVGKATTIGVRTFSFYLLTSLLSSCEGMVWVLIFRPFFGNKAKEVAETIPELAFQCDKPGYFLSHVNDTVQCVFDESFNSTAEFSKSSVFVVTDINKSFSTTGSSYVERTLSEAIQGQLYTMVPDNITAAFVNATLLSIVMFSIPFGVAVALLPRDMTIVGNFFREINQVFMTLINWVILCMPIAIISLLASAVAQQADLGVLVSDVGVYVGCVLLCLFFHAYVVYPALLRLFVKGNPYTWLRQMTRAQLFAFGSSSSMATLPVVMECIDDTGVVNKSLSRFVLSLGATIGMDGAALVYPIAAVFMAEAEGIGDIVGSVEYFLIILVSTIGAVGAGPVPSAGGVMIMTIWSSVFPSVPLPSTFAFYIATDWFIDRFQTVVNVMCDTIICRIVAEQVGETTDVYERESLISATNTLVERKSELKETLEAKNDA
ncbi:hypothetical protein Poli38472_003538 [Pythium oligandrum]|uniref:Amino acid transporter n=1 Tax=Pythium oligandrum TaxID=41045 RepID=A0A8K1FGA9_PYTOL|nr:hypothetical protein Poli38472_003538 [Pythium oligandrum]|eukprot:TMW57613.1 hypothetical protein Poli38472_003538 [Pythium oligandrum]